MTMTDDLAKRMLHLARPSSWLEAKAPTKDDLFVAQVYLAAGANRIEALTAERNALQAESDIYRAALNEIETAPEPDHWVPQYQHCVDTAELSLAEAYLFRALNTGKEPSHE